MALTEKDININAQSAAKVAVELATCAATQPGNTVPLQALFDHFFEHVLKLQLGAGATIVGAAGPATPIGEQDMQYPALQPVAAVAQAFPGPGTQVVPENVVPFPSAPAPAGPTPVSGPTGPASVQGDDAQVEANWQDLFNNFGGWEDFRQEKANRTKGAKFPDFKKRDGTVSLWLNSKSTPGWVKSKLGG